MRKLFLLIINISLFFSLSSQETFVDSVVYQNLPSIEDSLNEIELTNFLFQLDSLQTGFKSNSFSWNNLEYQKALALYEYQLYDSSLRYILPLSNQVLSDENSFKVEMLLGDVYSGLFLLRRSNSHYLKALSFIDSTKWEDQVDLSNAIGANYFIEGAHDQALTYFKKAYDLSLLHNDAERSLTILSNIGIVYDDTGEHERALEIYYKCLDEVLEKGPKDMLAVIHSNIGVAYFYSENYPKALESYNQAMVYDYESGNKVDLAGTYHNIGNVYERMDEEGKALEYYNKAYFLELEMNDYETMVLTLSDMAGIFDEQGKVDLAIEKTLLSYELSLSKGILKHGVKTSRNLADLYLKTNNYNQAYYYEHQHNVLSDSLYDKNKSEILAEQQVLFNTEERERQLLLAQKENEISNTKLAQSRLLNLLFIVFVVALLVTIYMGYRNYQIKKKSNITLQKQKKHIIKISKEIQDKNQSFIDSLQYASFVQRAVMPNDDLLKSSFSEYALFSLPHTFVSGDFYWLKTWEKKVVVVLSDCTGHGVPGGLLSMLGVAYLNDLEIEESGILPNEILDEMRLRIKVALNHGSEETYSHNGMDMACLLFDYENKKVYYSGAYQSILHVSKGELNTLKADKMPIGLSRFEKPFTLQERPLIEGDKYYLYSDGLVDQFGDNNRKFTSKRLKQILSETEDYNLQEQKEEIYAKFIDWKGAQEATDDTLFLSLKI